MSEDRFDRALLVVPRLRIQNANAISSSMTWGFPGITAFAGLMHALERRLEADCGLLFHGVGVVCHHFEAQTQRGRRTHSFHLSRNPVRKDGSTAGIVEEGRIHLDISLVFDVDLRMDLIDEASRQALADVVAGVLATMRVAGGSVIAPHQALSRRASRPELRVISENAEQRRKEYARLSRRLLPGFALVARDDVLKSHLATLRQGEDAAAVTVLDAWLDLSRVNHRAVLVPAEETEAGKSPERIEWHRDERDGWLVPIPVGFAALSELNAAGTVSQARDATTPLRFVESVYSIGQWISPHRLREASQLIWQPSYDEAQGLYRCLNESDPERFKSRASASATESDSLSTTDNSSQ